MSFKTTTIIFFLSILASCKKFLDIKPAPNLVVSSAVFSSDDAALSAVNGLYTGMSQSQKLTSGGLSIYAGLSADDIATTSANSITDPFLFNALTADDNTVYLNFYSFSYKIIYQSNAILEGLSKATQLTPSVKVQLIAETKLVRALLYFNLINLFGDVPLVTSTDYEVSQSLARTPVQKIYAQIIDDLTDAETRLSDNYPSPGKARPNRLAAAAFLARVYLFLNDFPNAEAMSTTVIASGKYSLPSNLNNVFNTNSQESIWEIISDNGNTTEGAVFVPLSSASKPKYQLTGSLLSSFEPGDVRKSSWIGANIVSGVTYYYPYKYKIRTTSPVSESNKVFRLAEQYLIRAEARARQNNLAGAASDLNFVRNRAGLPNTPALTKEDLLTAIEKERRTELFCEWGHRWFDLKRTGKVDQVMSAAKGSSWQSTDALYPIPLKEIQVNPFLTQNPGY